MNKYKSKKGISFLTAIGSYGGFHKTITDHSLHLCVGWIAFTIFFYDVENSLAKTLLKNSNEQLNIGIVGCSLTDIDKNKLIDDSYWLNLQNLSGREDFEEAFKLGIEVGVNELSEKLNV